VSGKTLNNFYMEDIIISKLDNLEQLIREQSIFQKEMLTFNEASKYLDVSRSHLYKMTMNRAVPHFCPNGKKLYFNRVELNLWLQSNKKASRKELEAKASSYTTKKIMV